MKSPREEPKFKVVAKTPFPPYESSSGLPNLSMEGYPHFEDVEFINFFPFVIINFFDKNFPLKISLKAYTPFIPLDPDNSGLPIAVFKYTLKNISNKKLDCTLVFSMMNPIGTDGTEPLNSINNPCFGKNINLIKEKDILKGIYFTSEKYGQDSNRYGNISLITDFPYVTRKLFWSNKGWWGDKIDFLKEIEDGKFEEKQPEPSPDSTTYVGSLGAFFSLSPIEEKEINFYLAWYFPNRINYWGLDEDVKGKMIKNYYATKFSDSFEVVEYFKNNENYLEGKSKLFAETFFSSTLPENALNTVSSQLTIIRSNTCFRADDGNFYGFEGVCDNSGCCPLNCTHVWNYEQALAFLFPSLERTMRQVDYLYNTDEKGYMAFRTNIPLGIKRWQFKPAADGQMGCILKLYREWKLSGDDEFLKKLWINAKKSMEFVWTEWDKNKDGLMEGEQHNTYDVELYGPNPFTSFLYLAALKAIGEMAEFLGEIEFSKICRKLFQEGKEKIIKKLWNGKYFIQKCYKKTIPPYQFLSGCLSDQLFGEMWAEILNLGNLVDEKYIKKTLKSIYKYNFKKDFSEHKNYMRIYALAKEKGLLMCTWPEGKRPEIPTPYSDEVWTGIEFQVTSHLIYKGFLKEAAEILDAIEERYDGIKRNPFNHLECGHHYARALACWGILISWLGFWQDNIKKEIYFRPIIFKNKLKIFFSSGIGWGVYSYKLLPGREIFEISVIHGFLELKKIFLKFWKNKKTKLVNISLNQKFIKLNFKDNKNILEIEFEDMQKIKEGESLQIIRKFS